MKRLFNQKEISRLVGISEKQIRYWDQIGLISRIETEKGQLLFDFQRLVAFRTVKELLVRGISLRRIRKCVETLRGVMPGIEHPLSETKIFTCGDQISLSWNNLKFNPDGQLLIDFCPGTRTLIAFPQDEDEELFFQGLEFEHAEKWEEAQRKYEMILARSPDHVNAMVNMGNILYRLGSYKEAEKYYRKALRIDPDHVEANYNLANIFEEQNEIDNAILFYQKAIHEDPEFTDAHFNLARILEKSGDIDGAKRHWLRYLELDPASEWAKYIRECLNIL